MVEVDDRLVGIYGLVIYIPVYLRGEAAFKLYSRGKNAIPFFPGV